jgi:hypothetical protein
MWAQLFFLLRTGHVEEAVGEALKNKSALDGRQRDFCAQFQKWVMSDEGRSVQSADYHETRLLTNLMILKCG